MPSYTLKSYQPRIGISGKTAAIQSDDPVGKALMSAGGIAANVANDFLKRKAEAKLSADRADYHSSLMELGSSIETARNDAIASDTPYTPQELHDKVVKPMVDDFGANIVNRGYARLGSDFARNNWTTDSKKILTNSIGVVNKMELDDIIHKNKKGYSAAMDLGDEETANEYLSTIRSVGGEKAVDETKSKYLYDNYSVNMQVLEESYIDGMYDDPNDYLKDIESTREDIQSSDMDMGQKKQLERTVNAKISNFKKGRIRGRDKAISDSYKSFNSGNLTSTQLEDLAIQAGPMYADAFNESIYNKFVTEQTTNDDASELYSTLKSYQDGELTLEAALHKIGRVKSPTSHMAVYLIGLQAEEFAKGSGDFAAYNQWNSGKTVKIDTYTSDLVNNITEYVNYIDETSDTVRGDFVDRAFQSYIEWKDKNPSPTEDEYLEWRKSFFKKTSLDIVRKQTAPQQVIATEAPVGGARLAPDGNWYVEKDGKYFKVK